MIYKTFPRVFFLMLIIVLGVGCGAQKTRNTTLYDQLGELEGVTKIVDNFLYRIAENKKIIHHFEDANIDRFREKLIEQICNIGGGPCAYTGDSMAESHRGMDINGAEFNSTVESLILAMQDAKVAVPAQNALLALLAPMHDEIMGLGN